ncbi:MAG: hypothetical protein WAW31_06455 [Smithella sp.]
MINYHRKLRLAVLLASLVFFFVLTYVGFTAEGKSTFMRLQFGKDVSIEVPRNWYFLDQNIRQHLNNYSETIAKLSGIDVNQGNNQILLAANAYINGKKPSATMRLSVRGMADACPSQTELKFADLSEMRRVAELSTRKLNKSLPDNVKNIKLLDVRLERLGKYYTLVTEQQIDYVYGSDLDRLDVICVGNKNFKLYTSYQKSEAWMFEPIIRYIRQSLAIYPQ